MITKTNGERLTTNGKPFILLPLVFCLISMSVMAQQPGGVDSVENSGETSGNGFYIHLSASNLAGKSTNEEPNSLSLNLLSAYKKERLSFGAGSGIEHLDVPLLPLYAYLRYDPFNIARASPYLWLKGGYSVSLTDDDTEYSIWYGGDSKSMGGPLFGGGIGLVVYTWPNLGINIGFGYRFQKLTIKQYDSVWLESGVYNNEYITKFNRFELQIGIIFR